MEAELITRKPYQGVWNIVRFNWHFYVISIVSTLILFFLARALERPLSTFIFVALLFVVLINIVSLLVSHYIYDRSHLYKLDWLPGTVRHDIRNIVNIHAGFDETSALLNSYFPEAQLTVLDFYDAEKHTEVSIQRARKAYPPYNGTIKVQTDDLPISDNMMNLAFAILAAHEIRNENERLLFFKEIKRILKPGGKIIVTEHLRDFPNFLAYTVGFFHFLSKKTWLDTFNGAGLNVREEIKTTPFITTFILE